MSRRNNRNLLGCSSCPLCCCKRRCSLSWRKSRLFVSSSSVLNSVISFIFIELSCPHVMACQKLRAHRQLVGSQTRRLARHRFRHTVQLKQNVAGTHRSDPVLGLTF